jgi:hypothetical protein
VSYYRNPRTSTSTTTNTSANTSASTSTSTSTCNCNCNCNCTNNNKLLVHFNSTYTFNNNNNLYYDFNVNTETDDLSTNESNVDYRYISSQRLSDKTWNNKTNDILTYEGIRYTPNEEVTGSLFRETLHILSDEGTIRASSIYEDSGTDSLTTIDNVFFPVQSADGIFKDIKIIKIEYDNDKYENKNVRTLKLLM